MPKTLAEPSSSILMIVWYGIEVMNKLVVVVHR